jgi:hypothetical protein
MEDITPHGDDDLIAMADLPASLLMITASRHGLGHIATVTPEG